MNKHGKFTYGRYTLDIDKMSTAEINKAIRKYSKMANTRLQNLRTSHMLEFSNTWERFHKGRLEKSFVGTKKMTFRTGISGSKTEKMDRLHYIMAFLTDPQTDSKAVREYAKKDIRYLFGTQIDEEGNITDIPLDLSTKSKMNPYLKTLRDIYDAYRDLGIDYKSYGSDKVLLKVASIIKDSSQGKLGAYDMSASELSTALLNLREEAARNKYTEEDFRDFIGDYGKEIEGEGRNIDLLKLLSGELYLAPKSSKVKGFSLVDSEEKLKALKSTAIIETLRARKGR